MENEEDQIVDPLDYSGDEDDLHEECDDDACVGVVRCVLSTIVDNDNWKHTSIFHTVIHSGDKKCKLVIDGGSSMYVVSKDAVKLLNFKVKPYPNTLKVAWVNDHICMCDAPISGVKRKKNFWLLDKSVETEKSLLQQVIWVTCATLSRVPILLVAALLGPVVRGKALCRARWLAVCAALS